MFQLLMMFSLLAVPVTNQTAPIIDQKEYIRYGISLGEPPFNGVTISTESILNKNLYQLNEVLQTVKETYEISEDAINKTRRKITRIMDYVDTKQLNDKYQYFTISTIVENGSLRIYVHNAVIEMDNDFPETEVVGSPTSYDP